MAKFEMPKINVSKKNVLGVVVGIATVITAINDFVSSNKEKQELAAYKQKVDALESKLGES